MHLKKVDLDKVGTYETSYFIWKKGPEWRLKFFARD